MLSGFFILKLAHASRLKTEQTGLKISQVIIIT